MPNPPLPTPPHRWATPYYNLLVWTAPLYHRRLGGRVWRKLWRAGLARFAGPVWTTVHGHRAVVNFGNTYPVNVRLYPALNNPLVELVWQAHRSAGRPVAVVDVGAATGDTVLLVRAKCPQAVGHLLCIDGDPEFFAYLGRNLGGLPDVTLVSTLLSAAGGAVREMVRTHGGTASAVGQATADSATLDEVVGRSGPRRVDVLKVDVDGYDGRVLLGAGRTLAEHRPAVIFEWHPILCEQTGNNWTDAFDALASAGYDRYVWFDKFGEFSHFTAANPWADLDRLAAFCRSSNSYPDLHYDVVALHATSPLATAELADATHAKSMAGR